MNSFEKLRAAGLAKATHGLVARGVSAEEAAGIAQLLEGACFPAFLAILATSSNGGSAPLGADLLRGAAKAVVGQAFVARTGLSAEEVQRAFAAVLVHRRGPRDVLPDAALSAAVFELGLKAIAARSGLDVSPEESRRISRLVSTGEFFKDLESATAAVLYTFPGLPVVLVRDVLATPHRIAALGFAIGRDVAETPTSVLAVSRDLLADGDLDDQPRVMLHTLACLFRFASLRSTLDMIATLIAPENETVRLAIVIYARANGIDLEPADLDVVRESLLSAAEPDLGPALERAILRLRERNGNGRLERLLARLGS